MKRQFAIFVLVIMLAALFAPAVFAQASGSVQGACKDADGNVIADGIVVWQNLDNGQKYTLKTNKKGEYFSLGITPGSYVVTLYKNADDAKANKELFHINKFQVTLDPANLDFNLKKEQENAAKGQGYSAEQVKQMQEQKAKQEKEVSTVKTLQAKLDAANAAITAGDYDTAITNLTEANQLDPTRDVIWYRLGDAYRLSMTKQTDSTEKSKRMDSSVDAYQKAIQIKQDSLQAGKEKDPTKAKHDLAAYYTNLADAYTKGGKIEDAMKSYDLAVQTDPGQAPMIYFNEGAILTNAGKPDEAIVAFDKCIAADPNRAEAYYQKGVNLLAKATLGQDNKMVAAPGTAEAFQKYLELAPTGAHSEEAKAMLASIGSSVETTFGTKKKTTTKK